MRHSLDMFRRSIQTAAIAVIVLIFASAASGSTIFSTIKGVVHDPQHRTVQGAVVTVKSRTSDWARATTTGADGAFEILAVPVGDYTITVTRSGFADATEDITVVSGTVPVLHFALALAGVGQNVTVAARPADVRPESATPTTLVDRENIRRTPGADRTNGLEAITAFVPGSYVTHDQLHVRGGHQVTWLIDGVPVPNTNIASNVGPQIDPKDIDVLEIQRGSYGAAYGDRTYGVFNVIPRTGFERNREVEIVASAGNFRQTNDQVNIGSHTGRFAFYLSGSGDRSDLGLGTPTEEVRHDRETGGSGFGSLVFNLNPANQFRIVSSARLDVYQIPNTPEDDAGAVNDVERESDAFINLSWVHSSGSRTLLTVSPFVHRNTANYDGDPNRFPVSTADARTSSYGGAQVSLAGGAGPHSFQVGVYGFHQQDHERFGIAFNDGSAPNLAASSMPAGDLVALFAEDNMRLASWLTVTAGVRQTHFSGGVRETAASPRLGAAIQIPRLNAVVRGFYGRFYQAPPLITASGPLAVFVTDQNLGFIPLKGERDEEYQIGVALPIRGWTVDGDRFRTKATNYFDHNPLGNSNIFFPVTIDGAEINGWEATLRSPRAWKRGEAHAAYAYQTAEGHGAISGGLTDFEPADNDRFFLDHDQRHTASAGFAVTLVHGVFGAADLIYGSGFLDGEGPGHLPGHATVNVSLGAAVRKDLTLSMTTLNLFNDHRLTDNSLTFGGVHYNSPREVYVQLRYRFHY